MSVLLKIIGKIPTLLWVVIFLAPVGWYGYVTYFSSGEAEIDAASLYVVESVGRGGVSSGIETTGEIIAAQTLDLDVYKQTQRIEVVNVQNGSVVEIGDTLLSFDKSDAYVDVESSQVRIAEAELALNEQLTNYTDPNVTIRTLENNILEFETAIEQAEIDKVQAYREYLNADLEAESGNDRTEGRTGPVVSGLYTDTVEGEYTVSLYRSGALSGYSYRVQGLATDIGPVFFGAEVPLGESGLSLTFSESVSQAGDEWVVAVPNTYAATYVENRETYEEAIVDLDEAISGYQLDIANTEEEIADTRLTDGTEYRDLDVAEAEAALSQARVQLAQNFDVVAEQDIVAPFSGTVEGMENVVVGAVPTRETSDPITLGTLISDEFLVTFNLGAVDVAKVSVGQKVLVTVTSFPNVPVLEANVTEISSLPNSSGVAQYEVQALIATSKDLDLELREGLLADVEVVQEEVADVLRVPSSAVDYERGQAQVTVLDVISAEQQALVDSIGVLRVDDAAPTYPVDVVVGLTGAYYTEIIDGLIEGMQIVVSQDVASDSAESAVQQQRFGPPRDNDDD